MIRSQTCYVYPLVNQASKLTLIGGTDVEEENESEERVLSAYQQAIYDDVATGKGHTVVLARAGAGKTTTIMGALASVPRGATVCLLAFNKPIAEELKSRAPKGVEVKTLHSHGYSAVRRAFPGIKMDDRKAFILAERLAGPVVDEHPIRSRYAGIAQLVKQAKDMLVERGDLAALDALIDRFGIDSPSVEDDIEFAELLEEPEPSYVPAREPGDDHEEEEQDGEERQIAFADFDDQESDGGDEYDYEEEGGEGGEPDSEFRRRFVRLAMAVLEESARDTTLCDYADMCWLPVALNLRVWAFDRVFVDETQDLSPSQIELLVKCGKYNGRILAVGDDRQAIYVFRGADAKTIPNLVSRLDAKVLPLSVTYRCATAIVELAQQEVPDLEAAPGAPRGRVVVGVQATTLPANVMLGDMIVSRTNAPLLGLCLKILAAGKRAQVRGRKDVGEVLVRLIERMKAKTLDELFERLVAWQAREMARLTKQKRSTDSIEDQVACVDALAEDAETVEEVLARARRLFTDTEGGDRGVVSLGTTHKMKGLEANRVWMLESTYRRNQGGEEANCWYVAVTRAKTELFLVVDATKPNVRKR